MKTFLTYGSSFELIITTTDTVFRCEISHLPLQDAVSLAQDIFDGYTAIKGNMVSKITICDSTTGEICAECYPDEEVGFDNPNYNPDWEFNEDMGFDPYLGLYTDDC